MSKDRQSGAARMARGRLRAVRPLAALLGLTSIAALLAAHPAAARFKPRIVGGATAPIKTYPFQVALYASSSTPQASQFCGGVILDATHVATAAHCVTNSTTGQVTPPSRIRVLAGTAKLATPFDTGFADKPVTATSFDPKYDPTVNDYDVAVLTLPAAPPLFTGTPGLDGTTSIAPIPPISPSESATFADPSAGGALVTTSGWGDLNPHPTDNSGASNYPTDLHAVDTHLVANSTCQAEYAPNVPISPRMVCAGEQVAPYKDSCFGDSGGPLTAQANATPGAKPRFDRLVGLVDSGLGCGQPNFPGIYVNTANADIATFMESNPPQAPQQSTATTISGMPQPGHTLTCGPGAWSGSPAFSYQFAKDPGDGSGGVALTSPSPQNTYTVNLSDNGTQVFCEVKATNAGGYGFGDSPDLGVSTPSSPGPTTTIIKVVTDTTRPLLHVVRKSCVRHRCTVNVQVADPDPSAGIREVATTLRWRATVACRRNGRRVICRRTRTLHPTAKSIGGGHFLIRTPKLAAKTTYRLTLIAFDKAGNRQLMPTRLSLRG